MLANGVCRFSKGETIFIVEPILFTVEKIRFTFVEVYGKIIVRNIQGGIGCQKLFIYQTLTGLC